MAAESKARVIEGDIAMGNFDPTLKKYKSEAVLRRGLLSALDLLRQFTQEKSKSVYSRTLEKYHATINYLAEYFKDKPATYVDVSTAENFAKWLREKNGERVLKERLGLLKACREWGIKQNLVEANPWVELPKRVKVSPKQMPKPFSLEEIGAIIQACRTDRYYHHYADYVEFLFGTGCRTSEAIGLRWGHLFDDCSKVGVAERAVDQVATRIVLNLK